MDKTELNKLYEKLETIMVSLEDLKNDIIDLQAKERFDRVNKLSGKTGVFDGLNIITDKGETYPVPQNYAVKSRIVFGDTLKMANIDGKDVFKQLIKLPRIKVTAVVSAKEGSYYALTEYGSHRLSSVAVDYNNLKPGDHIQVRLPENNTRAPYATFDKLLDESNASDKKVKTNNPNKSKKNSNYKKNSIKEGTENNRAVDEGNNSNVNITNSITPDTKNNVNNKNIVDQQISLNNSSEYINLKPTSDFTNLDVNISNNTKNDKELNNSVNANSSKDTISKTDNTKVSTISSNENTKNIEQNNNNSKPMTINYDEDDDLV